MPYPNTPPPGYRSPPFPSLNVRTVADPTQDRAYTLYYLGDVWKFTVIWTLIAYALFHCGALLVAAAMRSPRKPPLSWRFVCLVPLVCLVTAGLEALLAGSVVGLMSVPACLPPAPSRTLRRAGGLTLGAGWAPSTTPATTR